jgi:hypothetical protein
METRGQTLLINGDSDLRRGCTSNFFDPGQNRNLELFDLSLKFFRVPFF